jgi:hypothetical protein
MPKLVEDIQFWVILVYQFYSCLKMHTVSYCMHFWHSIYFFKVWLKINSRKMFTLKKKFHLLFCMSEYIYLKRFLLHYTACCICCWHFKFVQCSPIYCEKEDCVKGLLLWNKWGWKANLPLMMRRLTLKYLAKLLYLNFKSVLTTSFGDSSTKGKGQKEQYWCLSMSSKASK